VAESLEEFALTARAEELEIQLAVSKREASRYKAALTSRTEELLSLRASFDMVSQIHANPHSPEKWTVEPPAGKHQGHLLLMITDTHFDEVVRPEEIMFLNAFNRDIAEKRLTRAFTRAVRLARDFIGSQYVYDGVTLAFGGDMITGTIHEELARTNEAQPAATVDYFTDPLISGLELLADEFGSVDVYGVPGNHDRTGKKITSKYRATEAWSWVLYKNLERNFRKDARVNFHINEAAEVIVPVYDTNFLLHHGNDFRGGGGISGFLTPLALGDQRRRRRNMNAARMTGDRSLEFDYQLIGHFHQRLVIPGIIVGSSLKGYDEYARASSFDYAEPSQELMIVTPEKGITFQAPVFVMDREAEGW
jgi:DNA repair exonuclease SbcCD nuclease subunit